MLGVKANKSISNLYLFVRKAVAAMRGSENVNDIYSNLAMGSASSVAAAEAESCEQVNHKAGYSHKDIGPHSHDEQAMTTDKIDSKEKEQILSLIRRVHVNSGHDNLKYLKEALERKGASPNVLEVLKEFPWPVCEEKT